jgi:Uncharacterised nucleotidyltransferase
MPADVLKSVVLRFGLDEPASPTPVDAHDWRELLGWARAHNLIGQLSAAAPTSFELSTEQSDSLDSACEEAAMPALAIEASAVEVRQLLDVAGIEWRVLKGLATSRLLYTDPAQRSSRDIDILVRPPDLEPALDALASITGEQAEPQAGPVRAAMLKERQITDTRGVAIDVHQAIEGSLVTSRLPVAPLFAEPQSVIVGGVPLQGMNIPAMFVHSVLHSTSGGAQLSTLPDLGRLARMVDPDESIVGDLLAGRQQRDLFAWSLQLAATQIPIPLAWREYAERHQPHRARRRLFDSIHHSEARLGLVNVMIGEQRVRRAAEVVWPSEEYLQLKQRTRVGNLGWLVCRAGQIVRGC